MIHSKMAVNPATVLAGVAAADMGVHMGQKYLPGTKNAIHHLFGSKTRRTAKSYLQSLTTAKGLGKALTKDAPRLLKKGAKLVKSGKILKKAEALASDVGSVASAVEGVAGENKYTSAIKGATESGLGAVRGVHEDANKFVSDVEHGLSRRGVAST